MQVHPSRARYPLRFAVPLLASLALSSCGGPQKFVGTYKCKDEPVTINWTQQQTVDVHPKAVYLCTGKKVTWNLGSNVQSFTITFQDYPFGGNPQTFDQIHNVSPAMPAYTDLMVYKYSVAVVDSQGNSHPQLDPHVVGGGGLGSD